MIKEWAAGLLVYTGVGLSVLGSGEVGYGMGHQVYDVNNGTVTDNAPELVRKLTGNGVSSKGEAEMALGQATLALGIAALLSGNQLSSGSTPAKS